MDNFTHGLAVAGSFCISNHVGIMTTIAIVIHEVPHEVRTRTTFPKPSPRTSSLRRKNGRVMMLTSCCGSTSVANPRMRCPDWRLRDSDPFRVQHHPGDSVAVSDVTGRVGWRLLRPDVGRRRAGGAVDPAIYGPPPPSTSLPYPHRHAQYARAHQFRSKCPDVTVTSNGSQAAPPPHRQFAVVLCCLLCCSFLETRAYPDADIGGVCVCVHCVRAMLRSLISDLATARCTISRFLLSCCPLPPFSSDTSSLSPRSLSGWGLPVHLAVFADPGHVRAGDRRLFVVA